MTKKSSKKPPAKKSAAKKPAKKSPAKKSTKTVRARKPSGKSKPSVCASRPEIVAKHYQGLELKFRDYRKVLGRGLTLGEKILFSHLDKDSDLKSYVRGKSFIMLRPDRVAMQDATAQMAILQFIQSGKKQVAVPSTVHCDHLIVARKGSDNDMKVANKDNEEVYDFLASASRKYGIKPCRPRSMSVILIMWSPSWEESKLTPYSKPSHPFPER